MRCINKKSFSYKKAVTLCIVSIFFVVDAVVALAQTPAQFPLLTKSGVPVNSNLVMVLDDSGSMAFRHMPEDKFSADTFATTNPVGSNTVRWMPEDTYQAGVNFWGTVPGNINSTNYVLRALRSPDTNSIFYNPEIRYLPWLKSDGITRFPNSSASAAFLDPINPGTTVNLTSYVPTTAVTSWCYAGSYTGSSFGSACLAKANNDASLHHDPGVYFRLNKSGEKYLAVNIYSNYTGYSINNSGFFQRHTARTDCVAVAGYCSQAEERQNFANWFSYYRTRNLMTRGSLMEAFANVGNTFRLGIGSINTNIASGASVDGVVTSVLESNTSKYGGGGVRDFNAARKGQLFKWLEDLTPTGGTPLPDAMRAIGEYYRRTDSKGPWTDSPGGTNSVADNKTCRRSFLMMATDGYWTFALGSKYFTPSWFAIKNSDATAGPNISSPGRTDQYTPILPFQDSTSSTLADVAMEYWKKDLQPSMDNKVPPYGDNFSVWQNMTTFTIGLGVRGTLNPDTDLPALKSGSKSWPPAYAGATASNIDDLWHAAVNGHGSYLSAKNSTELIKGVQSILSSVVTSTGSTTGVATASTFLSLNNRKYVPTFTSGEWSGDVISLPIDTSGSIGLTVWKALDKVPLSTARNIVTWQAGGAVNFNWANIDAIGKSSMGSVASIYTDDFINFLRGDHTKEGIAQPFRSRISSTGASFVLGDFVNSTPVFIKDAYKGNYDALGLGGVNAYSSFLAAKAMRVGALFVGGNDGMLHAFKDSVKGTSDDGQEVFAYVPRAVYPNLYKLTDKNYGTLSVPHQYYVDGPLSEADAYVKAPSASTPSWRNYLMGTLGAGGRAVFALDVTNSPTLGADAVRWEVSDADDPDIGYVMSAARVGVLPNGKWVAIFGNGLGSSSGKAVLFVVDLETAAISKLVADSGGGNGLGGVALVRDVSGQITSVYAGDLNGKMWRFDYDALTSSKFSVYGGTALFEAKTSSGGVQPITTSPAIYPHSLGGRIVIFGTGKLFEATDVSTTAQQSIYSIWDKPADVLSRPLTRAKLASRSVSSFVALADTYYSLSGLAVDNSTQRGWNIDIDGVLPGGRVIYPTQVVTNTTALVSAAAPVQGTPPACEDSTGLGINFFLQVESGFDQRMFDTNGDGVVNSSDSLASGFRTKADGIDAIVKSNGQGGGCGADGDVSQCGCVNTVCTPDPFCPGQCLTSDQTSTTSKKSCQNQSQCPTPAANRRFDRVWRRVINPPIR